MTIIQENRSVSKENSPKLSHENLRKLRGNVYYDEEENEEGLVAFIEEER